MADDAEPKWPRTRRWTLEKGEIGPAMWALTKKLVQATAHDGEIAHMVSDERLHATMVDIIDGHRAAERHLEGILRGLTLRDGHAGRIAEDRPRRSLWAEITAHNDLRISVFRGHTPEGDGSLDAIAPMRKFAVDRYRILQIKGGGRLFEEIPPDGFYERTLIDLHADIGEMVVDLWDLLVARISAGHDLQEGDKPVLADTGYGRRLTMTTAEERRAIEEHARIRRAAEDTERERVRIEEARQFIAGLTGDPVRAAQTIANAKGSRRAKTQEAIRPALISCGLLSEGEEAADQHCSVLAMKLVDAVRLTRAG